MLCGVNVDKMLSGANVDKKLILSYCNLNMTTYWWLAACGVGKMLRGCLNDLNNSSGPT